MQPCHGWPGTVAPDDRWRLGRDPAPGKAGAHPTQRVSRLIGPTQVGCIPGRCRLGGVTRAALAVKLG